VHRLSLCLTSTIIEMTRRASEGTFLTDREESEMRSRRADFVRETLKPVTEIFELLQNDTKSLDNQLKREIVDGFLHIKAAMELKFSTAEEKRRQEERRLEEIEREFENSDLVIGLKTEIRLYAERAVVMQRQEGRLQGQMQEFQSRQGLLSGDLVARKGVLRGIHRESMQLHRELEGIRPVPRLKVPKLPLFQLFKEVPFEVFSGLSSLDVGHLSLKQLKTYIEYKAQVQQLKVRLARLSAQVKRHQLLRFSQQTQLSPCDLFLLFLSAFGSSQPDMPRSLSTTRLGQLSPPIEFQTLAASRLFCIGKERERSIRRQRKAVFVSRKALGEMGAEQVIAVLVGRPRVVERLGYFLGHCNVFGGQESGLCETKRSC